MSIWYALLFLSGGLVAYHFVAYPGLAILAGNLRRRKRAEAPRSANCDLPSVSLIVAAYNEEKVIAARLANALSLDYPEERLEILVVADGSDDRTHEIASAYKGMGVRAMHEPARRGKSAALNRGVEVASGEIVVFSDANNDFSRDALRYLVRHFADPDVGGVCGRKSIRPVEDRESSVGDGMYWRYEARVKIAESDLGLMTNADGEIFAVRRSLWEPIPLHVINDDTEITFSLVRQGYRLVYEPSAVSTELASCSLEDDYRVKVRMIAGGFQTVQLHWRALLPPRDLFAWAFLSHKLLRWLIPLCLLAFLTASVALRQEPVGAFLLAAQVGFYGLALLGWMGRRRAALPAWKYLPLYFGLMNVAALVGLRRFLGGDGINTIWKKAAR